jgi:hypothetical protein
MKRIAKADGWLVSHAGRRADIMQVNRIGFQLEYINRRFSQGVTKIKMKSI